MGGVEVDSRHFGDVELAKYNNEVVASEWRWRS